MTTTSLPTPQGSEITWIDILKIIATVLMIIDHIGYFFYPDIPVFRVIGRWCVPIWFFLIGYAGGRMPPWTWWVFGAGLSVLIFLNTQFKYPYIDILINMALIRLLLLFLERKGWVNGRAIVVLSVICIFLWQHTVMRIEYGTEGLLLALGGIALRTAQKSEPRKKVLREVVAYLTLILAPIPVLYVESFPYVFPLNLATAIGMSITIWMCAQTRPDLKFAASTEVVKAVQLISRHTFEIYVAHLSALLLWSILSK
jgi:membrane protein implicated in regulation of membrane protease activity